MIRQLAFVLPFMVCLSWAVALLISWKKNLRAQNVWAIASLMAAITGLYWTYLGIEAPVEIYSYIGRVSSFTEEGFFCILFFFYWSLIDDRPFTRKQYALFILPILLGTTNLILTLIMGHNQLVSYMTFDFENYNVIGSKYIVDKLQSLRTIIASTLANIIDILLIQCLLIIIVSRLFIYRNKQKSFFLLPGQRSWAVLKGLVVLLLSMLVYYIGEYLYFIEDYIPFYILFILLGSLFFYIGYHVYHLDKDPESRIVEPKQAEKQEGSQSVEELLPLFNKLIDKDRIYLNSDLRIDEVAILLHVDRGQVSDLIEEIEPTGFAAYINRKRVEYAQKLKQDNPQMTQEEIALQSGFGHTVSFGKAFRKYMGQTFNEWQKQLTN